eukprot:scaffold5874_cov93-Skeletonema_marinoi.AAC.2
MPNRGGSGGDSLAALAAAFQELRIHGLIVRRGGGSSLAALTAASLATLAGRCRRGGSSLAALAAASLGLGQVVQRLINKDFFLLEFDDVGLWNRMKMIA